jgi:predicted acetyltransferase
VGAALVRDSAFTPKNDIEPQEGSFLFAVNCLKQQMQAKIIPQYFDLVNKKKAPMIDVWLVAVSPQHQGKGILHQMLASVEHFGAKKSY